MTDSNEVPEVKLREEILATAPYRQGKPAPANSFKLSSNENPFEPLDAVTQAISKESINRYPDATAGVLSEKLAAKFGVSKGEVHVGSGSVSILAQLIQAAARPGDEVLYSWRSFEAYPGLVTVAGAKNVQVPNLASHDHDLEAMAAAVTDRTRVVIVCTPNNPTGTVVSETAFAKFMAAVPSSVLVLLDEAYVEFVTDSSAVNGARLLRKYRNLVILRTFSKAFGLAGLRVGYALGPEWILNAARATAIPLSVTEAAQLGAIAALDNETELLQRVDILIDRRERLMNKIAELNLAIPKSQSNFVWLPSGEHNEAANEILLSHGIVGRVLGNDGIRISVGEEESLPPLFAALEEISRKFPDLTVS